MKNLANIKKTVEEFDKKLDTEYGWDKFIKEFMFYSGFDTLSSSFRFKNLNTKTWVHKKETISSAWLWKHFNKQVIVSLPHNDKSNIYWIDIDARNNIVKLKNMIPQLINKIIKAEPFYIEYSPASGGYHLAFRFDFINHLAWKNLTKYVKEKTRYKAYNIEIILKKLKN